MSKPSGTGRNRHNPYALVAAGALAAGLGVAWVDSCAVAVADTGTTSTANAVQSAGPAAASPRHSAAVARISRPVGAGAVALPVARRAPEAPGSHIARSAANSVTLDPLQYLTRQLKYIFNNTAPTIDAGAQSGAGGTVTGTVIGQSNNGFELAYTLGDKPQYGTADVNVTTGAYTYTPNAGVSVTADEFTIVANNGTAAQLPGLFGLVQNLLHAVTTGIGLSSGDTAAAEIAVSLTGQTVIGNPTAKIQFWQTSSQQLVNLATASMVLGQLTDQLPDWDVLIQEAKTTDSVVKTTTNAISGASTGNPRKMYNPGKYPETLPGGPYTDDNWVFGADARQLLQTHGTVVTGTYYSKSGGLNDALRNLTDALLAGQSIIVYPRTVPDGKLVLGDAVTVLGIDFTNQQVYINDGEEPRQQQGRTLSLDDFVRVWGPTYETVVVKLQDAASV